MRILIAGFQHETNTFAPSPAAFDDFVRGGGAPAMAHGTDVLALAEMNLPVGGFIQAAREAGHDLTPVIWAAACPSAHVTHDAFERIASVIVNAAVNERYDAIYLDLHGAMVTVDTDDGEGELLARLRRVIGRDMPIVASLDLHANVTAGMLADADGLVAYRTYPHVDMAQTGRMAWALLRDRLAAGAAWHTHARRLPFLIPINGMCTLLSPARDLYERLRQTEAATLGIVSLSFAPGFPAADFPECGPVVWGHGVDACAVRAAVDALADTAEAARNDWAVTFLTPAAAVQTAMAYRGSAGPVVIADTQDNPGAGADSNTTGMLRALVNADAQMAALGLMWDPEAVKIARAAGLGATVRVALGGRAGVEGDMPYEAEFVVEHLSEGKCRFDGPMMNGVQANVGPVATLRLGGVRVVVSSERAQMLDRNLFRLGGVEPQAMRILVVKSSVHFRADFQPIASQVLVAKAPGPMKGDSADLPWRRLAPGMRTSPTGPVFKP
jgi:microcystin degradation protein MlrC